MYICICVPTTDSEIIQCIQDGCTLEELKSNLNICQCCMQCVTDVEQLYTKFNLDT